MIKLLLRNSVLSLFSSCLIRLVIFISSFIVARCLGKEEFGQFAMIRSTVSMVMIFAGMGLGVTATKYLSEWKNQDKKLASQALSLTEFIALLTSLLFGILLFVVSPFLANSVLKTPCFVNSLRIGSFLLVTNSLCIVKDAILMGLEDFKGLALTNVMTASVSIILLTIAAVYGNVNWVIGGMAVSYLFDLFIKQLRILKLLKGLNISYTFHVSAVLGILWSCSFPALIISLCYTPVFWYVKSVLVSQTQNYSEIAVYEACFQWFTILMVFTGAISNAIFPMMSANKGKDRAFLRLNMFNLTIGPLIQLVAFFCISPFASRILNLYGQGFEDNTSVFLITLFTGVIATLSGSISRVLTVYNKMWYNLLGTLSWALVVIFLGRTLVANYQSLGLAVAIFCGWLVNVIVLLPILLINFLIKKNE